MRALPSLLCLLLACSPATGVPQAPASLAAEVRGSGIHLSWTNSATGVTSFQVERKSGAENFLTVATVPGTAAEFDDSAVTRGTLYTFRARALSPGGISDASNEATALVPVDGAMGGGSATGGGTASGGGSAMGGGSSTGGGTATGGGSGGFQLQATDVLKVESHYQGTDLTLLVDTKVCFEVTLQHSDGSKQKLPRGSGATVSIASAVAGIVTGADADECAAGGIVGVSAGFTAVTVTLSQGSVHITAPVTATVTTQAIHLATMTGNLRLAVGATTTAQPVYNPELPGFGYLTDLGFNADDTGGHHLFINDVELLQKSLSVSVDNQALASATCTVTSGNHTCRMLGKAVGSTMVTLTYAGPHGTVAGSRGLEVVALPPLTSLDIVLTDGDGHVLERTEVLPGMCFVPLAYATSGAVYDLSTGVVVTTVTKGSVAVTAGTHANELCVSGNGITTVKACVATLCATKTVTTFAAGSVEKIELQGTALTTPVTVDTSEAHNIFCPDLHATLTMTGGATMDITREASWSIQGSVPGGNFSVFGSAWGAFLPLEGDPAVPCFSVMPMPNYFWTGQGSTGFKVSAMLFVSSSTALNTPTNTITASGSVVHN